MAVVRDDLGRAARKRDIEGQVKHNNYGVLHLRKQSKIGYNTMGKIVIEGNSQHCGIPHFKIVYNRLFRTHKLFYHALHEKT